MDLDAALRELGNEEEPNVIVEPEIGAFCMVHPRTPRARPTTGRLPLDAILAFMANPF